MHILFQALQQITNIQLQLQFLQVIRNLRLKAVNLELVLYFQTLTKFMIKK